MNTTQLGSLASERKQFIVLPEKIWHQQADEVYQQFLKQTRKKQLLVIDPQLEVMLEKFKPYTYAYRAESKNWSWEVKASLNGDLNAYAFPSGKIIINTGILWGLKLTEDELAFVLAHEIAHVLREHNRERMSGGLLLGMQSYMSQGVSPIWLLESEADLIAVDLLQRAGFHTQAALSFWQKFQQESLKREQHQINNPISSDFFRYRTEKIQAYLANNQLNQDVNITVTVKNKAL